MLRCAVLSVLSSVITSVLTITEVYEPCVLVSRLHQYVLEGTVVDCECGDLNETLEEVVWQSAKFGILAWNDAFGGNVARLYLTLTEKYNGDVFQCKSQNGTTSVIAGDFPIMVAYGPRSVTLTTNDASIVLANCPECNRTLRVTCVPYNYSPNASIAIYKNGTSVYNGTNNSASFTVSSGGSLSVICEARNVLFPDIVSSIEKIVEIREIPPAAPVMSVGGRINDSVTTRENENITIMCQINGGYPQVDNTTIQCGHLQPVSKSGSVASYSLNTTKDLDQVVCSCSGSHVTQAYNLTASLVLNVQYAAEIISFTVNDHWGSVEISNKSQVNFSCQASGNPLPYIAITSDNGNTFLEAGPSPLNFTTSLSCDDAAVYICRAHNNVGAFTIAVVNITGKCVNEFPVSPHQDVVPIIVGVVVPAAIIIIAIIMIVVIIRYKRSRPGRQESDVLTPTEHPYVNYANIGPGGSRLSGSYSDPTRESQVTMNPYETIRPGTMLDQNASDSPEEYRPMYIPPTDHILGISEEEQSNIIFEEPCEDIIPTVPAATCTNNVEESSIDIIPTVPGDTSTLSVENSGIEIIPIVPGTTSTKNITDSGIEIMPIVPGATSTRNIPDSSIEIIPIVPGTTSTKNVKDSGIEIIPIVPPVANTHTVQEAHLVNLRNKPPPLPKKTRPKLEPVGSLSRETVLYQVPTTNARLAN